MWLLMLTYPEITEEYIFDAIYRGRTCYTTKMLKYYRKLVGGLTCSNNEQIKLRLLMYVLTETYETGITCFNSVPMDTERMYIELFINYLNVECADCGNAFFPEATDEAATELNYILLEADGEELLLENGRGSHLMENN